MTCIAYRDGILAADTLVVSGDARRGYLNKIAKNEKTGAKAGGSGLLSDTFALLEWVKNSGDLSTLPDFEEMSGIYIDGNNQVYKIENGKNKYHPLGNIEFYAVGSGFEYAYGAMAVGATAKQAVEAAIKFCTSCGGEVETL